jgi:hypothetical protein
LKEAFIEKTERYREVLTIKNGDTLKEAQCILYDIQKQIN